ncbi:MAG: creatininase family protein [Tannerella sp.]|jgi:creatinine amidohydrolase|nr:creatininase family protein [Tannerella sp.]
MKKLLFLSFVLFAVASYGQKLAAGWDELTAPDFVTAVKQSEGVCIIPMGVIEKHGPHLPLGTDVFTARELSRRAAEKEYCLIFPFYFAGQIYEARQQPGTIAYSNELLYRLLEETCREISRNGIKKIILVNGHGGNGFFLQYFCQSQLANPKDYAIYLFQPSVDAETQAKITDMRKSTTGGHADEMESSTMMVVRPDLVKPERATDQSGEDLNRLQLNNVYTGIWWYAKYPNHYAGDAKDANAALGEVSVKQRVAQLAEVIRAVKDDTTVLRLQNEFFKESSSPLDTTVK